MRIEIIAQRRVGGNNEYWSLPKMYAPTMEDCKLKAQRTIDKQILPLRRYDEIKVYVYDPKKPRGERLIDKWSYRPTYRD